MMRYSDSLEIVCISDIRRISGNLKTLLQTVLIVEVVIVDLIQNFPISTMEIRSIMDFSYDCHNGHNGPNFHDGNWKILDHVHYGSHK